MRFLATVLALGLLSTGAHAAECGGGFAEFVKGLKSEAKSRGFKSQDINAFFNGVAQDSAVLKADRSQGVFQKPFVEFANRLISKNRIAHGQKNAKKYKSTFDRIERDYGVSRGVLLAFWAFETDYGAFQGDFNTLNALVTLSHDCRRPELFRPQVFAALELYTHGDFDPRRTTGAWAGEIGMVQMLPADILENGMDGDGDGHVSLKTSAPDALLSGGKMLSHLGWRAGQPWLEEVTLPKKFAWEETGLTTTKSVAEWAKMGVKARDGALDGANLSGSILLPQGRFGPAFMAYPNFNVYFEWNQSFVYVTTAAYFATRLEGAKPMNNQDVPAGLSGNEMKTLQKRLKAKGYDVGKIDGILGAKTRDAVRDIQQKLGLPADAWPDQKLLNAL
jgi:lytic murein transglycosylase